MRIILKTVLLSLVVAPTFPAHADDPNFVMLGEDRLDFPNRFALPSQSDQEEIKKEFRKNPRSPKELGPDCPFLDSVEFGIDDERVVFGSMFDVEPSALMRRDTGVYARPKWDNLGYFLKPLQTRAQFEAAISVLNKSWLDRCLGGAQLQKALREIRADKRKLPLEILQTAVDEHTLIKRGFATGGVWYAHFVLIEGASLTEHKYAIDARNRVAHNSRVLVKGPPEPAFSDQRNDSAIYIIVGCPLPESAAHKTFRACSEFLRRVAFLDQWKRELSGPDATKRAKAAQDICCLFGEAAGAEPELTMALADDDSRVRCLAAEALEWIGPSARIAIPALRKALRDKDHYARLAAARAVFKWGEGGACIDAARILGEIGSYSSIALLQRGLNDDNLDVRCAATAAIEAIECRRER